MKQQIRINEGRGSCSVDLVGMHFSTSADTREIAIAMAKGIVLMRNPSVAEVEFEILEPETKLTIGNEEVARE